MRNGTPTPISISSGLEYIHPSWFPIENRPQLISRLILALQAAKSAAAIRLSHQQYYDKKIEEVSDVAQPTAQVSGSLQPNVWTKVVWGWGLFSSDYQGSGAAFPVTVRHYPVFKEYTLPSLGCFTFQVIGYADVWFNSATGGSYSIGLCQT